MQAQLTRQNDLSEPELTPPHSLGFEDRLASLMAEIGIHKSGFITFLVDSTGLSKSGARKMLDDKRPPKRYEVFLKLATTLTKEINAKKDKAVSRTDVISYLLENKPIKALLANFDISDFVKLDAVRTSQIILKIEQVARNKNINTSKDINPKMLQLIQFRVISYCFKNEVNCEETKVTGIIESLFELAGQNLL